MNSLDPAVSALLDRNYPRSPRQPDWDDVLDRAGEGQRHRARRLPRWRVVAVAAVVVILVGGLLVTPALGIGDRLLSLIQGRPSSPDVQTPAWSPDGRRLAFVSRRDGNSEIYVMNADGSAQENLTREPASDSHPGWSRDGRLVFVSRRDGNSEIYVMNADGSGLRNLTRTPSDDLDPTWSPDGRTIAYVQKKCLTSSCRHGRWEAYLAVVHADGSGLRRLTTRPAYYLNPSWSADGKTIRYAHALVNADGSGQSEMPRNVPLAGVWSPDGQRIAIVRFPNSPAEARDPTQHGLWVMNSDGRNARRVAAMPSATGEPAWSPDGRRIAFRRASTSLLQPTDLFVVNADGSGLRRLTRKAANLLWFAWSPDGRRIAFVRNREVYIVKADGSAERRLT